MNKSFDVFLSHNSKDTPAVRALAEALQGRGLKVWLDEWELVPGRPWQETLEEVIETTGASAVLVGKDGLGPWQDKEMRGCLSEFVDRNLPVIPVLLPGAPEVPRLPIFLKGFTWVDLRGGLTEEGIDRLQWGITGERPDRSKRPSNAAPEAGAAMKAALDQAQPASAEVSVVPEIEKPAVVAQDQPSQTMRPPESLLLEVAERASPWPLLDEKQGGVYKPTTEWWMKNRFKAGVIATIALTGLTVSYLLSQKPEPPPSEAKPAVVEPLTSEFSNVGVAPVQPPPSDSVHDKILDQTKNDRTKIDASAEREAPNSSMGKEPDDRDQRSTLTPESTKTVSIPLDCSTPFRSTGETVLTDEGVKFGYDKTNLNLEASVRLTSLAQQELLKDSQILEIEIQGHTDSMESPKDNCRLGKERAEAVRSFLVNMGIPSEKIRTISYGDNFPINDNTTEEHRAQNRRVALVVLH